MTTAADVRIVLSTLPSSDVAASIARTLVEERLCACVNVLPAIRSIYRWQGTVHDEPEVLALIKTTSDRYDALAERLRALHPYEVPEILALDVAAGAASYLAWVGEQV
jgi:periplasmic divalent cation tolerance protein